MSGSLWLNREEDIAMSFHSILVEPVVALIAGILILLQPNLLAYIVAIYLIVIGVFGMAPMFRG